MKEFSKPQVTIDLEEYNELLSIKKEYNFIIPAIVLDYLKLHVEFKPENSAIPLLKKEDILKVCDRFIKKVDVHRIELEGRNFAFYGAVLEDKKNK